MRTKLLLAAVVVAAIGSAGVALANHVTQLDPATVPTGFLAAHNRIDDVPISPIARAAASGGAELFVQHVRLDPNVSTSWHTHPGPAIVEVVRGSLSYEDAAANTCRRVRYEAGTGFVDRGFGHVHRAVAGAAGADFYVVYVLPPGSETHVIPATAPEECT
jgi:hypothetical protein